MKTAIWRLLPVLALCLVAAGRKQPELTVRFYTEAKGEDGGGIAVPVTIGIPPRRAFISKIPNISEREIQGIYLFPGIQGTIGCSFFLDEHGKVALDTLSVEKRGTSLVALVNGRQVIDMLIDKRISDGIVTIPGGLTPEEGRALQKAYKAVQLKSPQQ